MNTRRMSVATAAAVMMLLWLGRGADGQAPGVRVLASNGVKAVMEALLPQCERAIGGPVEISFNSSTALKQSIDMGDAFDVAIVTTELMSDLVREKKVAAGTSAVVARSGIGVGIRQGASPPDIRTPEALKHSLLEAHAISYAQDGASRTHIVAMLDRMGIARDMGPKTILEQGSIRSAARVAAGDADFVITLVSEILPIPGITLVGPLPAELQSYVSLAAGVGVKARNAEAAKALVAFLAGPSIASTLKAKGMDAP